MSRITRESFIEYSKKLLRNGSKVCPCCLSSRLEFTTDDEHQEYWLECKACHIGIRDHIFMRVNRSWNNRSLDNPKINRITYDIECNWWNDETEEVETVTLDDKVYNKKDLMRDLQTILGERKLLNLIEMEESFFLGTSDIYGNRPVDESGIILIDKSTGTYTKDGIKHSLECTGAKEEYYGNIALTIPYEYKAYSQRISDELCFKGLNEIEIMNAVMNSTHFENIDYDTMRSIVFMYIDKKDTLDMSRLTLDEKVRLSKGYMEKGKI